MTILITGANKGIGYEIAKKYRQNNYQGDIIITSRNEILGQKAIENLKIETDETDKTDQKISQKFQFVYCQLDITDPNSRKSAIEFIKKSYPAGLDILVNNAGIVYKKPDGVIFFDVDITGTDQDVTFSKEVADIFEVNYFGTTRFYLEAIEAGVIKKRGRILTCTSMVSDMYWPKLTENDKNIFRNSKNLSLKEINGMVDEFISYSKNVDNYEKSGQNDRTDLHQHMPRFLKAAYGMSKIFSRSFVEAAANELPDYLHFSYCPGWCRTELAGPSAIRSGEEGARVAYYLGVCDDENVVGNNGGYFKHDDELHVWGSDVYGTHEKDEKEK